ncbi:MAG: CDP-diacylglycerol--glycerol-3-phosphate 3-phosphatidyltransferase [Micromonosporaceae bacterium]
MTSPPSTATSMLNVANALTVLRLVLVPVFVWLAALSEMTDSTWRIAATVAFLVAAATDYVDGWLARSWDQVTEFGKIADPIADKALTGAALVFLSAYGQLAWWVTVLVLAREIGVTLVRFWVIRQGVIAASWGGKAKTALQIAAIAWYLWPWPDPYQTIGPWIMGAAVVITAVTGVDYLVRALVLRRKPAPDRGA